MHLAISFIKRIELYAKRKIDTKPIKWVKASELFFFLPSKKKKKQSFFVCAHAFRSSSSFFFFVSRDSLRWGSETFQNVAEANVITSKRKKIVHQNAFFTLSTLSAHNANQLIVINWPLVVFIHILFFRCICTNKLHIYEKVHREWLKRKLNRKKKIDSLDVGGTTDKLTLLHVEWLNFNFFLLFFS